jgi:PTS system nitrogen regulatory IIA component
MHFGATLRLLRVEAGISLRELASRIGVSGAYLSRVENGHDPAPTPDRLVAIADALGLPRPVLVELARQAGPAVDNYLQRTPEAGALFLDIARRGLQGHQLARIRAFIDVEFPNSGASTSAPRLTDRMGPARVIVGMACSDLEDLISVAASRLGPKLDARMVVERVLARPHEQPMALGGGFACVHAVVDTEVEAVVMLTLAQPLAFPTPDRRPARVAFLLVCGSDTQTRLELLARIARLASYDIADELCAAPTPERAHSILERVESLW